MLLTRSVIRATALTLLSPVLSSAHNISGSLPVVDLGYELHRAAAFNQSRGYYNFSNIRYAAPPVGDLRFKAPQPPVTNRAVINDGSVEHICPQASSTSGSSEDLLQYILTGQLPNITTTAANSSTSNSSANITRDPRESEDCLFLDVIVPQKVFDCAGQGRGAPVLVWIHGGGYQSSWKTDEYDPSGLIQRSISNSSDGVIFVTINYRLGAFGFLSGTTLQHNGTANAGLHDQRFALEWVQENIHLFGGDKDRVTVFGESAGAGCIIHQITAYGGLAKAPFQQAIPQSPGWGPYLPPAGQEQVFQAFLKTANASSLEELRSLPSDQLIAANARQIAEAPYGQSIFSVSADGTFVPEDPKQLLAKGLFDHSVRVMVGHNTNEGLSFAPLVTSDAQFDAYVRAAFPAAPQAELEYAITTLYPPSSNASAAAALYKNPFDRAALVIGDAIFTSDALALNKGFGNRTYAYLFAMFPGVHGQDVAYTYFDPAVAPYSSGTGRDAFFGAFPFNETVALVLQDYITSFAITGVPRSDAVEGLPEFGLYGPDASVVSLGAEGIEVVRDPAANERCRWWTLGLLG